LTHPRAWYTPPLISMTSSLAHSAPPSVFDLEAYDYHLPPAAIAQEPAPRRDEARLLVLERASDARRHLRVRDLPEVLRAGDLLVMNDTRVLPARLRGTSDSGAAVELLLIRATGGGTWECMGRPVKRLKPGKILRFGDEAVTARVVAVDDGRLEVAFDGEVTALLERRGELPLPPYIERAPGTAAADRERYQTVYARNPGAVAAPTAGLHFTPELLERLAEIGVERAMITLHVGPGTFQPVRVADVREHRMEAEWVDVPPSTADAIAAAKCEGRRVIAIGTTTTRALESRARPGGVEAGSGWADGFILPGVELRVVDALMTNFHLPKSTLLMLVAALAGRERILDVYRDAVERGYRFYSYGDAMLIL